MPSPAENVAWLLNLKGVGSYVATPTVNAWPIKVGFLAPIPNQLICLIDSGGFTPNTKWQLDFPTVQVIIRTEPDVGYFMVSG